MLLARLLVAVRLRLRLKSRRRVLQEASLLRSLRVSGLQLREPLSSELQPVVEGQSPCWSARDPPARASLQASRISSSGCARADMEVRPGPREPVQRLEQAVEALDPRAEGSVAVADRDERPRRSPCSGRSPQAHVRHSAVLASMVLRRRSGRGVSFRRTRGVGGIAAWKSWVPPPEGRLEVARRLVHLAGSRPSRPRSPHRRIRSMTSGAARAESLPVPGQLQAHLRAPGSPGSGRSPSRSSSRAATGT